MSYRSDDPEWRRFKENELAHELYWEDREMEMEARKRLSERNRKTSEEEKRLKEEKESSNS
jgi:hypothetical protein